jgi:hypothetical protein
MDYATPQPRGHRRWLIVLVTVTATALLAAGLLAYAAVRQRRAALQAEQRALLMRAQAQRQAAIMAVQQAALRQQQSAQTRPAPPHDQPEVQEP